MEFCVDGFPDVIGNVYRFFFLVEFFGLWSYLGTASFKPVVWDIGIGLGGGIVEFFQVPVDFLLGAIPWEVGWAIDEVDGDIALWCEEDEIGENVLDVFQEDFAKWGLVSD
jgi:hypothetical protein